METNKNAETTQQEILKLLDGLTAAEAKHLLHRLIDYIDHKSIVKSDS